MDYTIGEINRNLNGFPDSSVRSGTSDRVIFLSDWEETKEFAEKYNLDIVLVRQTDGDSFWYVDSCINKPIDILQYIDWLGENYRIFDYDEWIDELPDRARESNDLVWFFETSQKVAEVYLEKQEGDYIILKFNQYYETVPGELMTCSVDNKTYKVGVLAPYKDLGKIEEETEIIFF
jgi:hypothetical protein